MLMPSALMVLAIYWKPSVPPSTSLRPPQDIQQTEAQQRMTKQKASPQQQTDSDGVVRDRNDQDRTDTGLWPDPQAGDRVVLPRQD